MRFRDILIVAAVAGVVVGLLTAWVSLEILGYSLNY